MILILILLIALLILVLVKLDKLQKTFIECFYSNLDKDFKDVVE